MKVTWPTGFKINYQQWEKSRGRIRDSIMK